MPAPSNPPVDPVAAVPGKNLITAGGRPRLFLIAFLLGGACWLMAVRHGLWEQAAWPGAVLLVLGVAATLECQARNLPFENVCMAAAGAAVLSGVAQFIALRVGAPPFPGLGLRRPGLLSEQTFNWALPLLSMVILLNSRGAARFLLRGPQRLRAPGYWTIGLASVLASASQITLPPPGLRWLRLAVAMSANLLILVCITPWLISKKPGQPLARDAGPLILWLAVNGLLAAVNFL